MTTAQLKDRIEQLEAQVRFWQACYRKAVSHDGRIIDTLRFAQPPCYRRGYNGAGYYQPRTHPCAARYHLTEEAQHGAAQ